MTVNSGRKKVGIITMHKVHNFGSALQAYALQRSILELGFDCELIDYIYPNNYHYSQTSNKKPSKTLKYFIKQLLFGFPAMKINMKFKSFYNSYFFLSKQTYNSIEEIHCSPPIYNIYITGSDQVWNPHFVKEDTTFMLSFIPNSKLKISYASSFSTDKLDENFIELYRRYLIEYSNISVREKNGANIIRKMLGKDVDVVLDPTLLLTSKEWNGLVTLKLDEKPYILVYMLGYVFDPFPYAYELIEKVRKQTGYSVKVIGYSIAKGRNPIYDIVRNAGPLEFIQLFSGASFIITSSFHGTAFALNFNKSFYSLVNEIQNGDDRQLNLLRDVNAEDRAIRMNSDLTLVQLEYDKISINNNLNKLRERSISFLEKSLSNYSDHHIL